MIFQAPRHFHIESFCLKYPSLAEKLLLIFHDPRKTFLHIKSFLCPPPRSLIPVFYSSKAHCSLFRHGHAYFILCRTIKSAMNLNRTFPLDINYIIPPHINHIILPYINQRVETSLNCGYLLSCK